MSARSLLDAFLSFLFPDRCAGCRKLGALFCPACQAALVRYPKDRHQPPASLTSVQIIFLFRSPLREAVHQLKYRRVKRIAAPLGAMLAAHMVTQPGDIDAVLATPLHAKRLAERGFNQAEALASEVARALERPLIAQQLIRTRATEQQAHLDARARAENMREAFAWQGAPPPSRVLLIDDVYTTGATMGACAQVLRQAGASAIYGLALARSRPD